MTAAEQLKARFMRMVAISLAFAVAAIGCGVAHFVYGVGWAIWGFVVFLALGFATQIWFIRGLIRTNRGG